VSTVLQDHYRWVLARLDADDAAPALVVLHGKVPKGQQLGYVLVYFRLVTPSGEQELDKVGFENTSDVINTTAYCHSVSGSPDSALFLADRVRAQLLGAIPTIAGRVCFPIRHDDSVPADRDETTGPDVFDQIDVYSFASMPA
jgi:hypothetical protein